MWWSDREALGHVRRPPLLRPDWRVRLVSALAGAAIMWTFCR